GAGWPAGSGSNVTVTTRRPPSSATRSSPDPSRPRTSATSRCAASANAGGTSGQYSSNERPVRAATSSSSPARASLTTSFSASLRTATFNTSPNPAAGGAETGPVLSVPVTGPEPAFPHSWEHFAPVRGILLLSSGHNTPPDSTLA